MVLRSHLRPSLHAACISTICGPRIMLHVFQPPAALVSCCMYFKSGAVFTLISFLIMPSHLQNRSESGEHKQSEQSFEHLWQWAHFESYIRSTGDTRLRNTPNECTDRIWLYCIQVQYLQFRYLRTFKQNNRSSGNISLLALDRSLLTRPAFAKNIQWAKLCTRKLTPTGQKAHIQRCSYKPKGFFDAMHTLSSYNTKGGQTADVSKLLHHSIKHQVGD